MLKSSSYYKKALKKTRHWLLPTFALTLFGSVALDLGMIKVGENWKNNIMEGTGYFEYVEENIPKIKERYDNGELTSKQYEAEIENLRNRITYLKIIGDEEKIKEIEQAETKQIVLSLSAVAAFATASLGLYWGIENKYEKLAKRAEKIEAMRAETDSIKVNYDPKHSSDDNYNIEFD